MRSGRIFDTFAVMFVGMVCISVSYLAWVILDMGAHWAHLYWVVLGVWGMYVIHRVERLIEASRECAYCEHIVAWMQDKEQ